MIRLSKTPLALCVLAFALTSLPALAQDTTAGTAGDSTATSGGTAPASGDGATDPGLSMGQPVAEVTTTMPGQAEAAVGQTYLLTTFDAWEERCQKTADGADPCLIYQLLKESNGNPVAEMTLFGLPPGQPAVAGANIVAPLETLLTKGVTLAIDGAQPKAYPFAFCTKDGCVARIGLSADEVAAMKKGAVAKVTIVPAAKPDVSVAIDVSLKGFTAAYDAMAATVPKQ